MNFPEDRQYHAGHLWAQQRPDGVWRIGVTDFAQDQLGGVIFVDLPEVGAAFAQGESCASIESVKVTSDALMPVSGEVTAVNAALADAPELCNDDPYGEGWFVEVRRTAPDEDGALTAAAYAALVQH
ncbi:glycine cleavage system protein GcvH [Desulfovibrio legallii]|jgi:glycine cleavage system H protein|uniref:Glycine cleavage system H protein n=1 Tax=Desulfovibrio legallii TaxID=571438 RepID=A0A1G7NWP4_9BACT|nr:glycine cleavage system protein GcvH [Desulfovibrio legallii]SDF78508.1 glycine cleavage system H protein [Desulfovibrio legallii]